jgi:putative nucleotidyltransferase with HDIG domain
MDRDRAVAFCREKCLKETTVRHLISVEGVMRALAERFEQDRDLWGLTGLFHDLDQDHTGDEGLGHAELAASWLRDEGVDERIAKQVLAHAYEQYRTDLDVEGGRARQDASGLWSPPRWFGPRRRPA